jgi:hypothetical protein
VGTLTEQHILVFPGVVYRKREDVALDEAPARQR